MPLASGDRLGIFEVRTLIGKGGMGEVYRARDTKLQRDVALKVLAPAFVHDPERLARFQREAHVLASLNHPRIATLYGLEDSGRTHALVMEFVEGPTLADRIAQGPIPWEEARTIALQLADAMEYAHDKNVVHRDIKPANIKVSEDGSVKVLDFGLAKALSDDPQPGSDLRNSPTLTLTMATTAGTILGTAAYMSPEQAKGKAVDRRADIWAFGVVLYEMLTGKQLFTGEGAGDILASVIKETPSLDVLPPTTPRAIRKLIERCIEKDPRRRLQAIGEARIAVEDAVSVEPEAPRPETAATPATVDARPRLWPWIAIAAASLLATAGLGFVHFRETPPVKEVLKYTIATPEKARVGNMALSPNGRMLVIESQGTGKPSPLWVRALDSVEPQSLTGTEGGQYPFWSPDSRNIGFFAGGKLKKIAVTGGPPQALCDAPDGRGGSWNAEGIILFAPQNTKGLQRVSASGGVPVDVTRVEGNLIHRFPKFLPDGRRFLYLSSSGKENGIFSGSLDAKPEAQSKQRLLADESRPDFAPPGPQASNGHLLFVREGTLMAQPMDTKSMTASGEVFPVAERVGTGRNTNNSLYAVSPGGMLVYSAGNLVAPRQIAWFDRSGKQLQTVGGPGTFTDFALSPDGKRMAATRGSNYNTGTIDGDLWIAELDRNTESRFTFSSANRSGVWSPDGSRIVFRSSRNGSSLSVRASDGSGQEQLLFTYPGGVIPTDWSRDGRYLIVMQSAATVGSNDIAALRVQPGSQGDPKPIPLVHTRFNEIQGRLSPDGHWLAYGSNESGQNEVYVQPFTPDGAPSDAAVAKWQVSVGGGLQAVWSHDGKELFYVSPARKLMSVAVTGTGSSFSRATPQELFTVRFDPVFNGSYAASPDGKRFLIANDLAEAEQPPLTVVTNWLDAVKK